MSRRQAQVAGALWAAWSAVALTAVIVHGARGDYWLAAIAVAVAVAYSPAWFPAVRQWWGAR